MIIEINIFWLVLHLLIAGDLNKIGPSLQLIGSIFKALGRVISGLRGDFAMSLTML